MVVPESLTQDRIVVRSVEIDRPRIDLGAPFPRLPAAPKDARPASKQVDVQALAIHGGEVVGAQPTAAAVGWLRAWRVAGLEMRGSWHGDRGEAAIDSAEARIERPGQPAQRFAVRARLEGGTTTPVVLKGLRIQGSGLTLAASGSAGPGSADPIAAVFDLDLDPRALVPEKIGGGHLRAAGRIAMPGTAGAPSGRVTVAASDLPAQALRPYLPADLFDEAALAGTAFDARADVTLAGGAAAGPAEVTWRRGARRLASLTARLSPSAGNGLSSPALSLPPAGPGGPAAASLPVRLAFDGALLPESPGRRAIHGELVAPSLQELAKAVTPGTRVELELPDLAAAVAELRALWPRLMPAVLAAAPRAAGAPVGASAAPPPLPLVGSLAASADLRGALAAPVATLSAVWRLEGSARVEVHAAGRPLAASGKAAVTIERLPLALLTPGLAGTFSGTASAAGSSPSFDVRIALDGEGVAPDAGSPLAPYLERLATLHAEGAGALGLAPPRYRGKLSLSGTGLAARAPGADSAAAPATVDVDRFLLAADGVLDLPSATAARAPMAVTAARAPMAPLAPLAPIPPIAAAPGAATALPPASSAPSTASSSPTLPLAFAGTVALDAANAVAHLPATDPAGLPETVRFENLRLQADGTLRPDLAASAGRVRLDAARVAAESLGQAVEALHVDASADARELRLAALSGTLSGTPPRATPSAGELADRTAAVARPFAAHGRFALRPLLHDGDLTLDLTDPVPPVRRAQLTATLRGGVLRIDAPAVATDAGPASLSATVPLGALRALPGVGETLAALSIEAAAGPVAVAFAAPEIDSATLLPALGLPTRPERLRGGVRAELTFDPAAPAAGSGEVRLHALALDTPDARAAAAGDLVLRLGGGRIELLPVTLEVARVGGAERTALDLSGSADLAAAFRPLADPPASLVTKVALQARGSIESALLNPYLAGGSASGPLTLSADVSGPLDALRAALRLSGPAVELFWQEPYVTHFQAPEIAVTVAAGRAAIDSGTATLNGGAVALSGSAGFDGTADLGIRLTDVRYLLDYGLASIVGGQLRLVRSESGRSVLSGQVKLDHGVLAHDVDLDREVASFLFKPVAAPGAAPTALDALRLDLSLVTGDGVRIKNNIGDLRASWSKLAITGTAAAPVVKGRVDVDPGGLLFAYGQTIRVDSGGFVFTGDPLLDPRLDLVTTTSLQDPTIVRSGTSPLDALEQVSAGAASSTSPSAAGLERALTSGVAGYYAQRLASGVANTLGVAQLSVTPILVFGEANPSARLTVTRDISNTVAFALSVDLRTAERQSYLLDLHHFRGVPGLIVQGFKNDLGHSGGTVQQAIELGGKGKAVEAGPSLGRLRKIRLAIPEALSKRAVERAVRLETKEPVPATAPLDVEVDVTELLRRKGYPDPKIAVAVLPVEGRKGWVDVRVAVEPGPHATFLYAGDAPPRATRAAIGDLYRTDFYEASSLEEMRVKAVRTFRSLGYLDPQVAIAVTRQRPDDPLGSRTVVVTTAAGRRAALGVLRVAGVDRATAEALAARFPGPLAQAELAAALPGADGRFLTVLRSLGWPQAEIVRREVGKGGLTIEVAAGARQEIAGVEIRGVALADRDRLQALLPVAAGDPARLDLVSAGALEIERDLRLHGFADARVQLQLDRPSAPAGLLGVRYDVDPGRSYQLAAVSFAESGSATHPSVLRRVADLPADGPLDEEAVEAARTRLFRTGLFTRITAEVTKPADGRSLVSFALDDVPRFRLGYGARFESEVGTSGVVDFADRNLFGRGMTFGVRGLYKPSDRVLRLYLSTGGLFGTRTTVEAYSEGRRLLDDGGLLEYSREHALQLAHPIGETMTGRVYLRYRATHLVEETPDPFFPFKVDVAHPYVGTQLLYDTRRDLIDPAGGTFASVDLSASGPFLASDFEYLRLFTQANLYRQVTTLGGRPIVWAQSARVGLARAYGRELPPGVAFLAGGEFSVRGYPTEGLGPSENLGDVVLPLGGNALLVVNEELRFPLPLTLSGLLFFDAGQVWATSHDFGSALAKSIGVGLRARTPIGLLRLDAAFPLDRGPNDPARKFYVGFGNVF